MQLISDTYDFKDIRENNCVYVDKTQYVEKMLLNFKRVFIARPRRFGKSLMISTLESLFNAENSSLFNGLAIEKSLDGSIFSPHPVITLDMSKISSEDVPTFKKALHLELLEIANGFKVVLNGEILSANFSQLIQRVAKSQNKKIVLLIDEYDAPLIDTFDKRHLQDEIRYQLKIFNRQIKACEKFIDFVYITGISRFSKVGVFSELNNLRDLTMNEDFAMMFGYTDIEIENYFDSYIDTISQREKLTRHDFLEKVKKYYIGYSFDGVTQLYNPDTINAFFKFQKFGEYWIETGSQESVAKFAARRKIRFDELDGLTITESQAMSPGEITTDLGAALYLYQAGYLTLRKTDNPKNFRLVYSNYEVRAAISRLMVTSYFHGDKSIPELQNSIINAINTSNYESLLKICNRMFSKFVHQNQKFPKGATGDYKEGVYRSHLSTFFYGTDFFVRSEESSNLGDSDVVIEYNSKAIIFELKYYEEKKYINDADGRLEEATVQIAERNYTGSYADPHPIGVVVDGKRRSITRAAFNGVAYRVEGEKFVAFGTVNEKGKITKT
jgi:hypothetical protein